MKRWHIVISKNNFNVKQKFETVKLYAEYLLKRKISNAEFLDILLNFVDEYKILFSEFIKKNKKFQK